MICITETMYIITLCITVLWALIIDSKEHIIDYIGEHTHQGRIKGGGPRGQGPGPPTKRGPPTNLNNTFWFNKVSIVIITKRVSVPCSQVPARFPFFCYHGDPCNLDGPFSLTTIRENWPSCVMLMALGAWRGPSRLSFGVSFVVVWRI